MFSFLFCLCGGRGNDHEFYSEDLLLRPLKGLRYLPPHLLSKVVKVNSLLLDSPCNQICDPPLVESFVSLFLYRRSNTIGDHSEANVIETRQIDVQTD